MGYPVSVTQKFRQSARGEFVANGLTGRVHDFNDTTVTTAREDGHPIVVHRETSPTVLHTSGEFLCHTNFPLELAVAKNIHDSQGDTLACIKTYLDATKKHPMWSRTMLFTLFTRVRTLDDGMTGRSREQEGTAPGALPINNHMVEHGTHVTGQ